MGRRAPARLAGWVYKAFPLPAYGRREALSLGLARPGSATTQLIIVESSRFLLFSPGKLGSGTLFRCI